MTALAVTKFCARTVVGIGVGKIVREIVANNINDPESLVNKVTVGAGAVVLGSMVASASSDHVEAKIDEIAQAFRNFKEKTKETKEEAPTSDADPS